MNCQYWYYRKFHHSSWIYGTLHLHSDSRTSLCQLDETILFSDCALFVDSLLFHTINWVTVFCNECTYYIFSIKCPFFNKQPLHMYSSLNQATPKQITGLSYYLIRVQDLSLSVCIYVCVFCWKMSKQFPWLSQTDWDSVIL